MKSQKIWQIDFLRVFGVVQMYTQKEWKTKKRTRQDTIRNVSISGQMVVVRNGIQGFVAKIVITKNIKL